MAERETPILHKGNIQNLRFYKHNASGEVYYVNGFGFEEATMRTQVIYTQGFTGLIFIRPVADFESKFTLMQKAKK